MKPAKLFYAIRSLVVLVVSCLLINTSYGQTAHDSSMMKDCCMKKDGKMMMVKSGKMMPMNMDMTMKNGTTCMANGDCKMKNGKVIKMKEGDCMDMSGKMEKCSMMLKASKMPAKSKA